MYRSLLVPLDGSASSEHALPIAVSIARRSGATLHLVYVHVPFDRIYIEGVRVADTSATSAHLEGAGAYLEGVRARLVSNSDLRITCDILDGPVAGAISDYAATTSADLVILTAHGREGLARLWLGSVTDALVRWSRAPILLLPHAAVASNGEHRQPFQQILIPLDGSTLAEQILEHAIAFGVVMRAEFTLVHVVEPFTLAGDTPFAYRSRLDIAAATQQQIEAQAYLDRVAWPLQAQGVAVRTRVVIAREPANALLHEAWQHSTDLIAMATHGRGGLARMLVGNVARRVLRDSGLPILLYRPQMRNSSADRDTYLQLIKPIARDTTISYEMSVPIT
jgi:nucleotide-binding universal stress UspA family protein